MDPNLLFRSILAPAHLIPTQLFSVRASVPRPGGPAVQAVRVQQGGGRRRPAVAQRGHYDRQFGHVWGEQGECRGLCDQGQRVGR